MAELTIMLRRDPNTGKQNIIIKLDSDPDALPMEHEQKHRQLVQEVTGLKLEDQGELIVERVPDSNPNEPISSPNDPQKRKEGNKG